MRLTTLSKLAIAAAAAIPLASFASPDPASAAAITFAQHSSVNVAGVVLDCIDGDLTIQSGSFESRFHLTGDGRGLFHVSGTGVPRDVTLLDQSGHTFTMSGATAYSATFIDPDGTDPVLLTGSDFLVIRDSTGALVETVRAIGHLSPTGDFHDLDFGTCQPPGD